MGRYRLTKEYFLCTQSTWPTPRTLSQQQIHLGVNPGHYANLFKRILDIKIVELLPLSESTVENSVFGVCKVVNKSRQLIWEGDRANLFFTLIPVL